MMGMSEYYIVLNKSEVGPSVEKLLHIYRQTGSVDMIGTDAYKIHNASPLAQKATFAAFERAIDTDFPDDCDYCGNQPEECDCESDPPNAKDDRAGASPAPSPSPLLGRSNVEVNK